MTIGTFGWHDNTNPPISAANLEAMFAAGGAYTDAQFKPLKGPVVNSQAVADGTTDNCAQIQAELDALSSTTGGTLVAPRGVVRLATRSVRTNGSYGSVGALLHVPLNCQFRADAATSGTTIVADIAAAGLGAGDAVFNCYPGSSGDGRGGHAVLAGFFLESALQQPTAWTYTSVPPSAPWAILLNHGNVDNVYVQGAFRASVASIGDHNYFRRCTWGGYASFEFPTNYITVGDLSFIESVFQGAFCDFLLPSVTGTNRAIQGVTTYRCHHGSGQPVVYCPSSVSGQYLIYNWRMFGPSFEGMARGFVYDPNKLGEIYQWNIYSPATNSNWFAGPYPTDGCVPMGALVQCGTIQGMRVFGDMLWGQYPGPDPTSGCAIDCVNLYDSDFGDCSSMLNACQAMGVPFARVSGAVRNSGGRYLNATYGTTQFRLIKAQTAISAGDAVSYSPATTSDLGSQFATAGGVPAGVALTTVPAGGVAVAAYKGRTTAGLAHLGRATMIGGLNFASLPSAAGSSTLGANLDLGSGAIPPRTVEALTTGQTTIKATAGVTRLVTAVTLPQSTIQVDDVTNFPPAGTVVIQGGQTVTYTGISVTVSSTSGATTATLTGCTGGTGTVAARSFVANMGDMPNSGLLSIGSQVISYTSLTVDATMGVLLFGGIPSSGAGSVAATPNATGTAIGRVAQVASNSSFPSSGVCQVGSTYFRYAGLSGSTYLYGVQSEVTSSTVLSSGAAVTGVNVFGLSGIMDGWKQANASAIMPVPISGSFGQIYYSAALRDRLQPTNGAMGFLLANLSVGAGSGSYNGGSPIMSGTQLNGAATSGASTVTVFDTSGFPSSGTIYIAGTTVTYTGKTSTTFTGCSGTPTALSGAPASLKPQWLGMTGTPMIRARYATGATAADDQGLLTAAASYIDPLGMPLGIAVADLGPIAAVLLQLSD